MKRLTIRVSDVQEVSALVLAPPNPIACYVFAHGAGAGMTHPFMAAIAEGLAERQVSTLRYQFPFAENGSRRSDPPPVAHAAVRAAAAAAADLFSSVPVIAGGKSFGGRMTSQAQVKAPLPGVTGLAFLGFPLHPAGEPSVKRATHLFQVSIPMLFVQGTRDALADLSLLKTTVDQLGPMGTLEVVDGADHAFHVLARSGRTDAQALRQMLDALAVWVHELAANALVEVAAGSL